MLHKMKQEPHKTTQKGQENGALNERLQAILGGVVDSYTETGLPVGSKILAENSGLKLSGASVRLVMQDLERLGFLTHPHTSAGRIPTEEGFRYYAKNMVKVEDVEKSIKKRLESSLEEGLKAGKDFGAIVKSVSQTIGDVTGCASLVTAPKYENDPLEQIEFVRLSGERVLAVMVTASGEIENRVINVPAFIDTADLNNASSDLKKLIAGQTLEQARESLIAGLAEQRGRINEMIDQMMGAAEMWGQPVVNDGALVVAGSTNLFQYPELVRERLQGLIRMFEEKRLIMGLMDEVKKGEGVQLFIGKDSPLEEAKDCSIVASSYGCSEKGVIGTLGVIGPMRMNYKQTMGVVDYTSKLLSEVLKEQKEK